MKTKLGISAGIIGAAVCFLGLFDGYVAMLVIALYVLMIEENPWLRRTVVKAVAICLFFSLLVAFINFIPNVVEFIRELLNIFNKQIEGTLLSITLFMSKISNFAITVINIIKKIIMLMLGFAALNQGTVKFKSVDRLLSKHMRSPREQ
jgi:hypothetical protein